MYWAFPGLAAFDHMRRQLDHRNREYLAFSFRRVVGALTYGTCHRRTIALARGDSDAEDIEDEAAQALARIPGHMSCNVTAIDRRRHFVTAYLEPDRPALPAAASLTR